MVTNSGYPKLKIQSNNPFFEKQINRIIIERELLVDVVESNDAIIQIDIAIFDHIPEDANLDFFTYVILILDMEQEKLAKSVPLCNSDKVKIYKNGSLRESEIAENIQNIAYTIIAQNKASYASSSIAEQLKHEESKTRDYKAALLKSGEAQKLIMQPRFHDENFDMHIIYKPYRDVSGDVLFIQKIYEKIFIMIADVTGHGYLAGMYGASLYALANNYVQHSSVIEQSVDSWSQYMVKAAGMFQPYGLEVGDPMMVPFTANALFCIIDTRQCRAYFSFCGSGQEPPVMIKGGRSAKLLDVKDGIAPPLGEFNTTSTKVYQKRFYPGDSILLFTDGATEIFSEALGDETQKDASKMYSARKIEESSNEALNNGKKSPKEIVEFILKDAGAYSISEDLNSDANMPNITDDLTLMCIKWEGENFD